MSVKRKAWLAKSWGIFLFALFSLSVLRGTSEALPETRSGMSWSSLRMMAIQDQGRIKPFDSFAAETLLFVSGKRSWKGLSAVECMMSWLTEFEPYWLDEPLVRIDFLELRRQMLGAAFATHSAFFSVRELRENEAFKKNAQSTGVKLSQKEVLSPLDKKIIEVENKLGLILSVVSGDAWNLFPNPKLQEAPWENLGALNQSDSLERLQRFGISPDQQVKLREYVQAWLRSFSQNNAQRWATAQSDLSNYLRTVYGKTGDSESAHLYPSTNALRWEVFYNHARAFHWAWMLYFLSVLCLALSFLSYQRVFSMAGLGIFSVAFFLHAGGFLLRCYIAGRPPVTNMFESVIWVSWGCALFSLVLFRVYKLHVIPLAGGVFATVALILADNLPNVLDPTIHPLEPVLRSNFWLTIHVLTITLSYAAFALSLCLGNAVLFQYVAFPRRQERIQQFSLMMYRAEQIGVVLLALGTILGGVWADYSWGRFWGWDPKEVWALAALLLYLAVLHGRFTGWLYGFGFVVGTVLAFMGVLMAWYGVNFVLGVGLHSYGFGSGGITYVLGYVFLQLSFIGIAWYRQDPKSKRVPVFPRRK